MITNSIQAASSNSKSRCALSRKIFSVHTKNGDRPAQILIKPGRTPVFVYASCPTIPVHEEKPTTRQIDSVLDWESF